MIAEIVLGVVIPACLAAAAGESPRHSDLAGPWQLFVDDYLIADQQGVVRTFHPFAKHPQNPLRGIGKFGGRGTVLPAADGAGYRLWSGGGKRYYESDDGLSWAAPVKPTRAYDESHGCCSVIYASWEADPAQRYKMVSKYYDPARRKEPLKGGAWYGSTSPDGIHWTAVTTRPLFADRGDVGKFCWDPHKKQYFGACKVWTEVRGHRRRCVSLSTSREFDARWSEPQLILVPDAQDDRWATGPGQHTDFYGLSAFAYETMYLGLIEVFRVTDGINDGTIHLELVSSRDGVHWDRLSGERTPVLAVGSQGAWDAGTIKAPPHPIVERDTVKLFYGGGNKTHGFGRSYHATRGRANERVGGTGLATMRKDGFASLDTGDETGSVTTVPLRGAAGRLAVNYRAKPTGWLKVELLDSRGRAVEGYSRSDCRPLAGDSTNAVVAWRNRDELPAGGGPIRLRFWLHNASLFSFSAGSEAGPHSTP